VKLLRRHAAPAGALLLAGIGVVLVLLAFDVRTWQGAIGRDDVTFAARPKADVTWSAPATLPGDPAGALLGVSDLARYRRALELYVRVTKGSNRRADDGAIPVTAADAQTALDAVVNGNGTTAERSQAANLLGVLIVSTPSPSTRATQLQLLQRGATYLRQAIALDPTNYEAKLNLELVLRLQHPGKSHFDHDARAGYGFGKGHSVQVTGNGF
jgi:hypothetical protein